MDSYLGRYEVDLDCTGKLWTEFFRARLMLNAPHDDVVQECILRNVGAATGIFLQLSENALVLGNGDERDVSHVTAILRSGGRMVLVTRNADREEWRFELRDLAPGVIQLANEVHDLGAYAWRKVG
jgi:hypothetical protein